MADVQRHVAGYLIEHEVADESTTRIYKAVRRSTGQLVAIKYPKSHYAQIAQEINISRQISHHRILPITDVLETPDGPAIAMAYAAGGDLFRWIVERGLAEQEVKQITFHMLDALSYLHSCKMWHRDIKPENILMMTDHFSPDAVMLSDFGLCRRFDGGVCNDEFCGSAYYAAPELWRRESYTSKIDIWALGMTMYACLTGSLPFDCDDRLAMEHAICAGLPNLWEMNKLDHVSYSCRDLLFWMLTANQNARPTAQDALAHPWFNDIPSMDDCKGEPIVFAALIADTPSHLTEAI